MEIVSWNPLFVTVPMIAALMVLTILMRKAAMDKDVIYIQVSVDIFNKKSREIAGAWICKNLTFNLQGRNHWIFCMRDQVYVERSICPVSGSDIVNASEYLD